MPRSSSSVCELGKAAHSEKMAAKYDVLCKWSDCDRLLGLVASYVGATIPAADKTAGELWVATAAPARKGLPMLCCLSVGNVETLTILSEGSSAYGFVNMKDPGTGSFPWRRPSLRSLSFGRARYRYARDVFRLEFESLDQLGAIVSDPVALDWCYRLNAESMRRGNCMYSRFANGFLMDELLERVS